MSRADLPNATGTHQSPYHLSALPNGVRLLLAQIPQAHSLSVGIWVPAGGRHEQPTQAGISHFLEHLVFKGTRRRSCERLKREIEGVGGSLNGFTAEEFTCYMAKVPDRHGHRAIEVLSEMVCQPTLSRGDLEKEREVILEEIRMYEDSPGQYVHDLFNALLWPDHPLGMMLSGTAETVKRMSPRDLTRYWRRMYGPRGTLISCVGRFDPERVARQVRAIWGRRRGGRVPRVLGARRPRPGPQVRVWRKETEQTHLCLGTYAVPRQHPDRFALELLHVILGANTSSRLFREVREVRGLVYEIGSQIKRFQDTGAFVISAGCDPGKLDATLTTIFRELSRIRRDAIGRAELKRAQEYDGGQLLMGLEDTMDHMLWVGEQVVTSGRVARPQDLLAWLNRVRAPHVSRLARRLFVTKKMHVAIVGPVSDRDTARLSSLCRIT